MTLSGDQERSELVEDVPKRSASAVSAGRRGKAMVYAGIFLTATVGGLFLKEEILRAAALLIPDPNAGRTVAYWTSEHNSTFRSDTPGTDSMGMDLVPVYEGQEVPAGPAVIDPVLTERVYGTSLVEKGLLVRTIRTVSTIDYAEPRVGDVTLKVDAWLEKLHVDYEGRPVRRGDPLFELYSPELVTTQEEFLLSLQAWQRAKQQNQWTQWSE